MAHDDAEQRHEDDIQPGDEAGFAGRGPGDPGLLEGRPQEEDGPASHPGPKNISYGDPDAGDPARAPTEPDRHREQRERPDPEAHPVEGEGRQVL